MITGKLNLFTESDLDRLDATVRRVLQQTGIKVCDDEFLKGLATMGAQVDLAHRITKFPARLVEELVEQRRALQSSSGNTSNGRESVYKPGLAAVIAPFFHDYDQQTRRPATKQDLIDVTRWAEVDVSGDPIGLALTIGEVDPRIEPIEAYVVLLENTSRPDQAYTTEANQIEFLLEIASVYYNYPVFPRGTDFMTSPLTFGDRLARQTLAAIRFGQKEFDIGVMPICGGNAPMTIAGNIVTSAAEILGGWLTIKSLQPEAIFGGGPCNGIVDMRRGVATFNAPEALLADLGVCELFERRYGGGVSVAAGADYIDARLPGLQAAYERTYRAMAIAAFTGAHFFMGGNGTLDEGKIFSPVQYILEREMGEGLWRLGQGVQVNDDTLALEAIELVGPGEGNSYLDAEHTLHHFRETWFPKYLYRGIWETDDIEFQREQKMLEAAYRHYREAIARYTPPELDEAKRQEMHKIVERARQTLLT